MQGQHASAAVTATRGPRGKREPLEEKQILALFKTLLADGAAWAAALMVTQLSCGERAGAMAQARRRWLRDLALQEAAAPSICIEEVTKKTKGRDVPVTRCLADLLHKRVTVAPLVGCDSQWAMEGQPCGKYDFLFPSVNGLSACPDWNNPWLRLRRAAELIRQERGRHREDTAGTATTHKHVFEDFDLGRLSTHSFKRSMVSRMKVLSKSTAMVGVICGTTPQCSSELVSLPSTSLPASDGTILPLSQREQEELSDHIRPSHSSKSNLCRGYLQAEGSRNTHRAIRDIDRATHTLHIDITGPFTTSDDGFTYTSQLVLYVFQVLLYSSMLGCLLLAVLSKFAMHLSRWLPYWNRSKAKTLPSLTPQESTSLPLLTLRDSHQSQEHLPHLYLWL